MCHEVTDTAEVLLSVKAVARRLNVHISTVYRLAESGRLRAHRIGEGQTRPRGLRIPETSVDEYLDASQVRPLEPEGAPS